MRRALANITFRRSARGGAMVEFALVAPLLVTLLLWSLYLTDLVRAKLRTMEIGRHAAFAMTTYPLSEPASGMTFDQRFSEARDLIVNETRERFADFDSVDDAAKPGFVSRQRNLTVSVQNEQVAPLAGATHGPLPVGMAIGAVNGAINGALNGWGFNTRGKVNVEVSTSVEPLFLPRSFLDGPGGFYSVDQWGGVNLMNRTLRYRFAMVASDWHARDGTDALMGNSGGLMMRSRAGYRNEDGETHAIYRQVEKMTFLGAANFLKGVPVVGRVMGTLDNFLPDFAGTYVVSHNYAHGDWVERQLGLSNWYQGVRGCNISQRVSGMVNLEHSSRVDGLTKQTADMRCFDTAPFRDTRDKDRSMYIRMFSARGPYGFGCQNAMADDPTAPTDPNAGDKAFKENCGPEFSRY